MAEENDDLKKGEKKTPEGTGQPPEKTTGSDSGKKPEDEKVEISKSELEKLQKDAALTEQYRGAVKRLNKRGRVLPGLEPEEKPKEEEEEEEEEKDEFGQPIKKKKKEKKEEFVTKKELLQRDEREAIAEACEDEEINLNWDEMIVFYVPPKERTKEALRQAISDAHRRWRADKGLTEKKPDEEGKKETTDLATDKGLGKGKEKETAPGKEKKHIIPKKQGMEGWYS